MTSSPFRSNGSPHAQSSSSNAKANRQPHAEDGDSDDELELLGDDFLDGDLGENVSFKRKPNKTATSYLPRFLQRNASSPSRTASSRGAPLNLDTNVDTHKRQWSSNSNASIDKDNSTTDWTSSNTKSHTGYDDLTAIDWIHEYTRERLRASHLKRTSTGLLGQLNVLYDHSQIWIVLILTGISAGLVAAFIDVASDWLADLKGGMCGNVKFGGRFYLNQAFCCWGADKMEQCVDWKNWGHWMGVGSLGGRYVVGYVVFVILSVLFAACASVLVKDFAPYARHSGIPEIKTMLGGFVMHKFLGAWTLVIKSLGLCLAVASGLWLGKEGPLVHVACCCANLFVKLFRNINNNEARKREVLSAAAAAGISVAFGSPVGGVLFSLEQLSYYFPDKTMWQSFVCAMVAAVTLQAFNPFRTGKLVLYQVTYHSGWHGFEMIPFALLGILGGVYGGLFINLNMKIAHWRRNNPFFKGPVIEVVAVAFVTALVNYPVKFMRAQASELVYTLFAECVDLSEDQLGLCKSGVANTGVVALLVLAAILGFFLASITFGLQIPAGIILPSLAIGALYGRAIGLILQVWQQAHPGWILFNTCEPDIPCVTPGTYAIVGAASALAGTTRMTVSIVVIMFELTGALTYVLPIMIAVMIAKWVGDAIEEKSIYEAWISFNGYPYLDGKDDNAAGVPDVAASQIYTRIEDLVVITAMGHTVHSLQSLLRAHSYRGFPVVMDNARPILLGYITRPSLNSALASKADIDPDTEVIFTSQPHSDPSTTLDLGAWMEQTPITLNAKATLQLTVNMFQRLGLRYVLFIEKGQLRGLLTKKDVWLALERGRERESVTERADMRGGHDEDGRGLLDDDEGSPVDERRGLG